MAILKNYTNARGFVLTYHRVVQVVITENQVHATLHSWVSKEHYDVSRDSFVVAMIETIDVPKSALSADPIASVEKWFIEDESSPLFGGSLDAEVIEHAVNN